MPNDDQPALVLNEDEKLVLPPKLYDKLKLTVLILLPTFSTLYFALGQIWGFPAIEKVIATAAAVATALGSLVAASAKRYKNSDARFDGVVVPVADGGGLVQATIDIGNQDPEALLLNKTEMTLKVAPVQHS